MTESALFFEALRKEYPTIVSKEQFYKIAHISKATACYLLQSGLVPCKDSGKRTRRYSIHIDDIIHYMIDRELHPDVYRIPEHLRNTSSNHHNSNRHVLSNLSAQDRSLFKRMIAQNLKDRNDLLTITELAELSGYSPTAITRWCNTQKLKSFYVSGKYLVPKLSFIEYIASPHGFNITRKSWKHLLLIKDFLEQKA